MATKHASIGSASTRSIQRPDSRASTTSATSHLDFDPDQKHQHALYLQGGPEAALLQYHGANAQFMPHDDRHTLQAPPSHFPMQTFGPQDTPYLPDVPYTHTMRVSSAPAQPGLDLHDDKRRKSSAVTATNDKELREMLNRNENRPLREVAQEVIQKERTPMAEKTKQLFAMLWLRAVCKPAKTSVPRNRVYSQYASRCANERVVPLNPASFGKLVRVIFPGIQTRRLGVRGESKYHYVDLALQDENSPNTMPTNGATSMDAPRSRSGTSASAQNIDFNNVPRLQADTSAFPAIDTSFENLAPKVSTPRGPSSSSRTFAWPEARGMQAGTLEAESYSQTLRFPSRDQPMFTENEPVTLPPIDLYLPPRTDKDTVEALCALYRTHCTSLIDSIRFCKEKQFFRLYTSFHGTLTVPVQKLFTHPNLAPWIEQCDLVMYRTMVRFVSRLTLQAAPVVVINIMSNISAHLHAHIAKTFASQPTHLLEAKLRPAAIFASLLYRLIRVNQSAHAAANLLTIDLNREIMWNEWQRMVNPKRVMEAELPAECPYEEVYQILTKDVRALLEPLPMDSSTDGQYGFQAYNVEENGGFVNYMHSQMLSRPTTAGDIASGVSSETILDRWSEFIYSLPARFPKAETRTLLHCVSAIGTASLRDITIMNGQSYGHWWVLKIFVDEMTLWLAEMGGFLEAETAAMLEDARAYNRSPSLDNDGRHFDPTQSSNSSGIDSRMSSTVPAAPSAFQAPGSTNDGFQHGMPYTNGMSHELHSNALNELQHIAFSNTDLGIQGAQGFRPQETDMDDSGIVMDDDVSVVKYASLGGRHPNELSLIA